MSLGAAIYKNSPPFLRTVLLNSYALSLNLERYGKKFERVFEEFQANEKLSRGEILEYQREKLVRLIRHAYEHVPYYRRRMNDLKLTPHDFHGPEDLPKLPILTRDDVKRHYAELKADNVPIYKLRQGHTSGTTGSALKFLWDTEVCVAHHAADWRQKKWSGFTFGDRFVSLQGQQIVPSDRKSPPFWVMNHVHNQLFMSSFHLRDEAIPFYLQKIQQLKPKGVEGYPSSLYVLARFMKQHDLFCPVPAVLTSSETLLPIQRELIEERFQCRVFDFYGMSERVVYASECDLHCGKHLNPDYGITEIVDKDGSVMEEGGFGTIVATGLWNYAMPLIRYRTSDASAVSRGRCACGREFPLMDQVTTKAEDIIVLRDGRMIPSSILTHPFKPLDDVVKSQIIQTSLDTLDVKIVKGAGYTEKTTSLLIAGLRERLGNDISINLIFLDDIPKEKSGKYRWVISKVSKLHE